MIIVNSSWPYQGNFTCPTCKTIVQLQQGDAKISATAAGVSATYPCPGCATSVPISITTAALKALAIPVSLQGPEVKKVLGTV